MTDTSSCVACGSRDVGRFCTKRNGYGEFRVLRCRCCSSAFVWPRPEESALVGFYKSTSDASFTLEDVVRQDSLYYPDAHADARRIVGQCRRLAGASSFLDVGAGSGVFSKVAVEAGFHVTACEPNPNAREVFLKVNGFEADASMFDEEYAQRHQSRFNVVLLSQVLEHVGDPEGCVRRIHQVLKQGGLAAITVPHFGSALSALQGRGDMYISPPVHLNFFSSRGLLQLFARTRFSLLQVETVSKVNRAPIANAVGSCLVGAVAWRLVYGALRAFDPLGLGMVLNGYFRREG